MNNLLKTVLLGSMVATIATAGATAQGMMGGGVGAGRGLVGTYCKEEIARYCPKVMHQTGAVPRCLAQHRARLSKRCRQALDSKGPGGGYGRGNPPMQRNRVK